MLAIISGLIVLAIVGVLIFAATKPDVLRVQRSIGIKSNAQPIFPLINDFHRWPAWSPWEKRDPEMKRTHGGAASGQGAVYEWTGNSKVGAGRMEILESTAPSRIVVKLDFIKPFEGHNTAVFALEPRGGETQVTWTMTGPASFMSKVMQVFMSMDQMIGKDFEEGLANLKAAVEKGST